MLAKLLLSAPDVMLLDEPSNHLDIDTTRWLEDYLVKQPEAMLIVSHDRYFLDRVVTKVFELHAHRVTSYPGNFKQYWRLRQERYEQELKACESQQEYIEKQEEYIRRVHYGQLHKQAASRQKQIDKIERLERPTLVEAPRMHFGEVRRSGDVVLQRRGSEQGVRPAVVQGPELSACRAAGGSASWGRTAAARRRCCASCWARRSRTRGKVQRGHLVELGYYDQHLKSLAADKPVIRAVWPEADPDAVEQRMRDLLGRFGLTGDQVYQQVGELSGGEKSRAALAKLVAQGVNVLVLDEPTNHLDLWACDALEQALLEFEGTVIVVSHDRYFLNRVVDLLLVLDGQGNAQVIHGNYDTYELMRAQQEAARAEVEEEAGAGNQPRARASERGREEGEAQAKVSLSQDGGNRGRHRGGGDGAARTGGAPGVAGPVPGRRQGEADDEGVRGDQGGAGAAVRTLGRGGGVELRGRPNTNPKRERGFDGIPRASG